eukprot:6200289-Pleurochrysis_carterae.AAC.2
MFYFSASGTSCCRSPYAFVRRADLDRGACSRSVFIRFNIYERRRAIFKIVISCSRSLPVLFQDHSERKARRVASGVAALQRGVLRHRQLTERPPWRAFDYVCTDALSTSSYALLDCTLQRRLSYVGVIIAKSAWAGENQALTVLKENIGCMCLRAHSRFAFYELLCRAVNLILVYAANERQASAACMKHLLHAEKSPSPGRVMLHV